RRPQRLQPDPARPLIHVPTPQGPAMRNRFIALAALVGYAVAAPVMAQSSLYDDSQVLISKIQTDKRAVVLGGMGLTGAETAAFTAIYDEYQAERKKLGDRTVDLLNKFVANNDSMT